MRPDRSSLILFLGVFFGYLRFSLASLNKLLMNAETKAELQRDGQQRSAVDDRIDEREPVSVYSTTVLVVAWDMLVERPSIGMRRIFYLLISL